MSAGEYVCESCGSTPTTRAKTRDRRERDRGWSDAVSGLPHARTTTAYANGYRAGIMFRGLMAATS